VVGGESLSALLYVSAPLADRVFVDAIGGYGSLSFDGKRFDAVTDSLFTTSRSGNNWFASVGLRSVFDVGAVNVSPYARANFVSTTLAGYSERGDKDWTLSYAEARQDNLSFVIGAKASLPIPTQWGLLTPSLRLEYQNRLDGKVRQELYYSAAPTDVYAVTIAAQERSILLGAVGLRAVLSENASLDFEYGASVGGNGHRDHTIRGSLEVRW
jgi:outer membrane autotransporter protein